MAGSLPVHTSAAQAPGPILWQGVLDGRRPLSRSGGEGCYIAAFASQVDDQNGGAYRWSGRRSSDVDVSYT